ncbi:MAG: hypothetical protein L7F77_15995 [Candidatus Magnetominusculus sp. LBB02]|nr:hypothetical protein [Candidatus Magnetominusculus sp. LBB02]
MSKKGKDESAMDFIEARAAMKSFDAPDEIRLFHKGKLEMVNIGGIRVRRATFEPGWESTDSMESILEAMSGGCPHLQYHMSGRLMFSTDDGKEFECKAGDVSYLPVGHDAWVVGDEPVVVVDFRDLLAT